MNLKDAQATWQLAWPIAVGQLATTGAAFVDAVMAGHVSAADLAAVAVGSSIWTTLSITLLGYLLAIGPMVAHKVGSHTLTVIPSLTQQALAQSLILAALAIVVAYLIPPLVFPHLGLAPEVAIKANDFLKAISWGFPAFALYRVLYNYSTALNQTKPMMLIALFCLLLNIPVNWIFIYGHLGFPAMGGVGCGWASAVCLWVKLILLSAWILCTKHFQSTHPFRTWQGWDRQVQCQIVQLGLPVGMMFFIEVSAFTLIALIIAKLGTTAIAAHQIAFNFNTLVLMIPMAIGSALSVRIAHALGAKHTDAARAIGINGTQLGLLIGFISGGVMIRGSEWIASLYTADATVIELAGHLLVLAGIFQFSNITQVATAGILRGYKMMRAPMFIHIASFWLTAVPVGYLLTFGAGPFQGLGVRGYWMGLIIGLTVAALSLQSLFRRVSSPLLSDSSLYGREAHGS